MDWRGKKIIRLVNGSASSTIRTGRATTGRNGNGVSPPKRKP